MELPPLIHIPADRRDLIADIISELTEAGGGWFNLAPEIPHDVPVPATPGSFAIFSKRGPAVPFLTWIAPNTKTSKPAQAGIQHGTSKRAVDALALRQVEPPHGSQTLSDHPKRGCVFALARDASAMDTAEWLCTAATALCLPPTTGNFDVRRYDRPSQR